MGKYNLRCNRVVSEKLLQKDFIYDSTILPKKNTEKQPRASTTRVPRPHGSVCSPNDCVVSLEKEEDDIEIPRETRVLHFKCNFCNEPIATRMSLSTHVKSHCREYCRICFWVVQDDESIDEHKNKQHNTDLK
ncbi:uncharacterized protein LOC122859207 [Aphidius gifuensis]|uniref:uncharacterized protein LOC122859207 n=1 Tax=Aphidius gifuensis TaxID=684658 RepID=UPI001CDBA36C|nr:uncharacterized protein LOC122859207 [Aphidius gifuensis]